MSPVQNKRTVKVRAGPFQLKKVSIIKPNNYFLVLFAIVCLIVFFLIRPLIQLIFIAGIIAYVFYPVYRFINKKIKKDSLSALIVILIIVLMLGSVAVFTLLSLVSQRSVFNNLVQTALQENLFGMVSQNTYLQEWAGQSSSLLVKFVSGILISIPGFFFAFVLMIFLLFYAFRDGKRFVKTVERFIPIKGSHKKSIMKKIDDTLHATIYGTIVVAFIQAVAATLGFYVFGVRAPVVWGMLTFLAAMIPFLGAVAVWLPIGSVMGIWAYMNNRNILPSVGVLIYGFFVISLLDNILKPKLIGDRVELHPVLVILGIVGGVVMFGFTGVFIGPVIMALFKAMLEIYQKEGVKWT